MRLVRVDVERDSTLTTRASTLARVAHELALRRVQTKRKSGSS